VTDPNPPTRIARLILVTRTGEVLGQLPPFPVTTPWWQDAAPVVRAARERHGVEVTILRLLEAQLPEPPGGPVTYLAEVAGPVAASRWDGVLDEHPNRLPYARPGGPAADLAWAGAVLADQGLRRSGPAEQVRTWNLSSLWRCPVSGPTARGRSAWLKVVPVFLAHEGAMLSRLAGGPVPTLLAQDGQRMLMAELPGADLYGAALPWLVRMVPLLVSLQQVEIGRVEELLALGLPDWRAPVLTLAITEVVERSALELSPADRTTLDALVHGLPERFRRLGACGLPDSLVHGDFCPGNVRGDGTSLALLDWGDSGVGHPLLDQTAFLDRIAADAVGPVRELWSRAWRAAVPGCDPERAAGLLAPVAAARQAVVYRRFLDGIEPSEHPYHQLDPARWLVRTAALLRREQALALLP